MSCVSICNVGCWLQLYAQIDNVNVLQAGMVNMQTLNISRQPGQMVGFSMRGGLGEIPYIKGKPVSLRLRTQTSRSVGATPNSTRSGRSRVPSHVATGAKYADIIFI